MTEEMVAPVAEAIEVPAEDATPNDGLAGKRSRAYEVFEADLNDTNYVFCQCRERVVGGNVCRKRVKCCHCPATPWSHLKSKHPVTHARLKACDGDGDTRASTAEERLAQPAQLAVNVSYQQMVGIFEPRTSRGAGRRHCSAAAGTRGAQPGRVTVVPATRYLAGRPGGGPRCLGRRWAVSQHYLVGGD